MGWVMASVISDSGEVRGEVCAVAAPAVNTDEPAPASEDISESPSLTVLEICLVVICVLLTLAFMRWAEAFIVPVLVGVLLSYTLDPAVTALERCRVQRVLGTLFVLGILGAGCGTLVYVLS